MAECPICGSEKLAAFPVKECNEDLLQCRACSMVFRETIPHFVEADTADYYKKTAWADREYAAKNLRLIESFCPVSKGHTVLDVGCNIGTFMGLAKESGWLPQGLDNNKTVVSLLRKNYQITLGTLNRKLSLPASFNVIYMSHVIEHIPDPVEALRIAAKHLRKNGIIFVSTPNIESWWTRKFQVKQEHLHYFSPKTLKTAIKKAGLEVAFLEKGHRIKDFSYADQSHTRLPLIFQKLAVFLKQTGLNKLVGYAICPLIKDEIVAIVRKK